MINHIYDYLENHKIENHIYDYNFIKKKYIRVFYRLIKNK